MTKLCYELKILGLQEHMKYLCDIKKCINVYILKDCTYIRHINIYTYPDVIFGYINRYQKKWIICISLRKDQYNIYDLNNLYIYLFI